MVADAQAHQRYHEAWTTHGSGCESGSNFPLALRQQKQLDTHQLYYNYPLIEVSASAVRSSSVLQTYNFRVNVTSRMYYEVGMHVLSNQVTLQLSALNQRGYTIQGKQRGNLNVLDVEIGPGDYSVALKQPTLMGSLFEENCAIFSLQGLVEPISLMSAAANSGEILQRGISACPEAADGDILPAQIYASKSQTRGGGELHVDGSGHFMRRFRNVLFKVSREYPEVSPEYDRVELGVVEDSWLHLSFMYQARGANEIRLALTDTWMLGQEVAPQASYKVNNIENDQVELITEYKLSKGRHYALTVYYVGGAQFDQDGHTECSRYDLTISVSHAAEMVSETRCPPGDEILSLATALPKEIGDKDLDAHGEWSFEKVLRLAYPKDFKGVS